MAKTPRRTPAHQMFVNLLSGYHKAGGEHNQNQIAAVARRVGDHYPCYRGGAATGMSPINIYKILDGRHGTLPTAQQLCTLVLALQRLAYHDHALKRDPGCETLTDWQALLSLAKRLDKDQRARGRFIEDTAHDPDVPLQLSEPPSAESAPAVPRTHIKADPIEVTPVELHELITFGHRTRMLAEQAAGADHRAFYEIAVVLGTAAAPCNERAGTFALVAASAAPVSSPAADLLDANARVDAGRAASHARVLAHAAAGHHDHEAERIFAFCAARVENPALQARPPRLHD
ncbi:hypothetical protein ACN3XK_54700 [Actinomadura welshii]